MAKKLVFCCIGERCIRVRFTKEQNGASDVNLVRAELDRLCGTDLILKDMLKGNTFVLQVENPKINRLCDLDNDDEINDGDLITVTIIKSATTPGRQQVPQVEVGNLFTVDDMEVVYEDMNMNTTVTKAEHQVIEPTTSFELFGMETLTPDLMDVEPSIPSASTHKFSTSHVAMEVLPSSVPQASTSKRAVGPNTVPKDVILPPLSDDLARMHKTTGVLANSRFFIPFWANHLLSLTSNAPTKRDYLHYAESIVAAYPELRGGATECGIVKTQLSVYVRNKKKTLKKKLNSPEGKSEQPTPAAVVDKSVISCEDINEALTQLRKFKADGGHVRRLMEMTFEVRRTWITKEAKSISHVVKEFPTLEVANLVLFDLTLLKKVDESSIIAKAGDLIEKLARVSKLPFETDQEKLAIFEWLYGEMCGKKQAKTSKLFISKKVMDSLSDLKTAHTNSPRMVSYCKDDGSLACSFIVGDENIQMEISQPTVEKAICILLAVYYVWDTTFPAAYTNVLAYLDNELLGTPLTSTMVLSKFKRRYKVNL